MNRIYKINQGLQVPDHTWVYEIVGPEQSHEDGLPITEEQSLACGILSPGEKSSVHIHPIVSHLTFVLSGMLTVQMKDRSNPDPYRITLGPEETVLTEPLTFFQLINDSDTPCKVLYMVAPAFVFLQDAKQNVLYNDAIVLKHNWDELAKMNWKIPELDDIEGIRKRRQAALDLLKLNK
jgi:mannose-6-phosphate isomerase-like protein (cupin superfamily)